MKKLLIILFAVTINLSCTDAEMAKIGGYGDQFKIELVSCSTGEVLRVWTSSGKVLSESNSDGYYFNDAATGVLTEVTGTIIITRL